MQALCREGTSRLRQDPPLDLRLRRTLESRILDCPFDGFEPTLGPVSLEVLSNGKFDPMSDEGRQLREVEGRRTENSVDSNGGHVARVARTARTDLRQGEAWPAFRGAAGSGAAGVGRAQNGSGGVRSRRSSCGGGKVHGAVREFKARGPFVRSQPVWRCAASLWRFLNHSSLVRGTSKRRSSRWVRPNISDNDRSVGAGARRAKVADRCLPDSARARCALAHTVRDKPSPVPGAAGELEAVAQRATRAEAARARAHNQRLARHPRPPSRALGDARSVSAARR